MIHLTITQSSSPENVTIGLISKLYQLAFEDANQGITSQLVDDALGNHSVLQGYIRATAGYEDEITYLTSKFPNLTIDVGNPPNYYIKFADPVVGLYCIQIYGNGADGITLSDIAGVNSNNKMWTSNGHTNSMPNNLKSQVTSLEDFLYFDRYSDEHMVYGFPNATKIKFPSRLFSLGSLYNKYLIEGCYNLLEIDYGNATFVMNASLYGRGKLIVIAENQAITDFSPSLLPNQTNFERVSLFWGWQKLQRIIFPEGITNTDENYLGMSQLKYVEYPTTITDLGSWCPLGQNGSNNYIIVIKAVNPPTVYYKPNDTGGNGEGFGWRRFPSAIFVPDGSVTAYKNVTPLTIGTGSSELQLAWCALQIIDRIQPMSNMTSEQLAMGTVTQADIDRT